MISAIRVCNAISFGIEMLCAASVTASITPVSCRGRKPFGTTTYSPSVPTSVAAPTIRTKR